MNKKMNDYINEMTSSNLEKFENLISLQYRKFTRFYKLVREYSSSITSVKYEFNSPSSLDVALFFDDKSDLKSIKKELVASMEKSNYEGEVKIIKKSIFMSIKLDEGGR